LALIEARETVPHGFLVDLNSAPDTPAGRWNLGLSLSSNIVGKKGITKRYHRNEKIANVAALRRSAAIGRRPAPKTNFSYSCSGSIFR
jgi:hypothetical protein